MTAAVTREGGVITITRTDGEGNETVTGHALCASDADTDGLALAMLFAGSQALLAGLKTAADMLEADGHDVTSFRESIAAAELVTDNDGAPQ